MSRRWTWWWGGWGAWGGVCRGLWWHGSLYTEETSFTPAHAYPTQWHTYPPSSHSHCSRHKCHNTVMQIRILYADAISVLTTCLPSRHDHMRPIPILPLLQTCSRRWAWWWGGWGAWGGVCRGLRWHWGAAPSPLHEACSAAHLCTRLCRPDQTYCK